MNLNYGNSRVTLNSPLNGKNQFNKFQETMNKIKAQMSQMQSISDKNEESMTRQPVTESRASKK
jgi:hypothetical protein